MYRNKTAAEQNKYRLRFIIPYKAVHVEPEGDAGSPNIIRRVQNQYHLRKLSGEIVVVCAKTFASLCQMDM